jgi:hypothetical protein
MSHYWLRLDGDFTRIRELDGISNEIEQDLRQAPSLTAARVQLRSDLDFEPEFLSAANGSSVTVWDGCASRATDFVGAVPVFAEPSMPSICAASAVTVRQRKAGVVSCNMSSRRRENVFETTG